LENGFPEVPARENGFSLPRRVPRQSKEMIVPPPPPAGVEGVDPALERSLLSVQTGYFASEAGVASPFQMDSQNLYHINAIELRS